MKSKLLLASFIILVGCDPIGRLTGISTKHEEPTQQVVAPSLYEGNFHGSNFVEVDLDGSKETVVYIKRGKEWIQLEGFETGQKTKDPYYVISKETIVFFNTTMDDLYSIKVTR